jgi:hypothetical protein
MQCVLLCALLLHWNGVQYGIFDFAAEGAVFLPCLAAV